MPQRYVEAIIKHLSGRGYSPLKPRQLARQLGVGEEDYGTFRQAVRQLQESGRLVLGAKHALTLPQMTNQIIGAYQANPRGFGFVMPQTPNAHGDLFIPPGQNAGAINGDLVRAEVVSRGKRDGRDIFSGRIVEILKRGNSRFVGVLERAEGNWFVLPEGTNLTTPVLVRDVGAAGPAQGAKVVVEIVTYPSAAGELPSGVIVETLGRTGQLEVETLAIIRAHGLEDQFSQAAMDDARSAVARFDPAGDPGREDITGLTVITIDPPDARDFDDAISLARGDRGRWVLGVHIADVSHFVREGSVLDQEARQRATSVYFPRSVVPMLPEILSNGVCSLQEGEDRFCKSAFIAYDEQGNREGTRFADTVIRSTRRLTYLQAQGILDGQVGGYDARVVDLLGRLHRLARAIEARRRKAGMLHLDLPAVELVLNDRQEVVDAQPEDDAYTHTLIEMFMVEANEAVAELTSRLNVPCLRRIHPPPGPNDVGDAAQFIRASGHKLPKEPDRHDLQRLLESVKGKPESYAVNLAVLKTFERAEYSPMNVGHYALASDHYCHFTSPIRRYADLTVHRLLGAHVRGRLDPAAAPSLSDLVKLGEHCTAAERRSDDAQDELREVLLLQMLAKRVGETFDGVVTGVTNFGMFVQLRRFLIEGLIRMEDLGDDWWEVNARNGLVRGQRSGKTYRIGDTMRVTVVAVDQARRQLKLLSEAQAGSSDSASPGRRSRGGRRRRQDAPPAPVHPAAQPAPVHPAAQPKPKPPAGAKPGHTGQAKHAGGGKARPAQPGHAAAGGQHPGRGKGKGRRRRR
jgi:ribonuclease R